MRFENRQTAHVERIDLANPLIPSHPLRVRLLTPERPAVNQSGDDPRQKSRSQSSPEVDLTSQPMATKIPTRTKKTCSTFHRIVSLASAALISCHAPSILEQRRRPVNSPRATVLRRLFSRKCGQLGSFHQLASARTVKTGTAKSRLPHELAPTLDAAKRPADRFALQYGESPGYHV